MKRRLAVAAISTLFTLTVAAGAAAGQEDLPKLVKKIQPAVATVIAYDASGRVKGQGSGFFISKKRFITNYHVLAGASRSEVKTALGFLHPVTKILAKDQTGDLIVAVIDAQGRSPNGRYTIEWPTGFPSLNISGTMPEVGERVVVVGSPLGLEQTLSDGIVSAVRNIPDFGEVLQITAPISPGSSGSPVVNLKGEVIGVASMQMVKGQNLNFAVPGYRVLALQQRAATVAAPQKRMEDMSDEELAKIAGVKLAPRSAEKKTRPPTTQPDDQAGRFFNQALKFYESGNYQGAIEVCKKAIGLRTDNPKPYLLLSAIYSKLGSHKEGLEMLKQVVRNYPDNTMAYVGLGMIYYNLGCYQESVEAYKQAIRLNPDLNLAHEGLGGSYLQLGYLKEGLAALKQANQMGSNDADIHLKIGIAYLALGNRGSALEEYKILQGLDKGKADQLFNLIYK